MQEDAITPGQSVIVIDDLMATGTISCITSLGSRIANFFSLGGSAKAAGELIAQRGCKTLEYLFIIELVFLKGHEKLDGPVYSIIQSND
jgi:adenine phosphoribosyltransferase